ncbi:MAG: hypothetical protein LBR73_07760 [Oscillospiraceae bacterium]|jgi:hypothetical protein|nr:hypothetical protein [Oscillospiraceae bacterium]
MVNDPAFKPTHKYQKLGGVLRALQVFIVFGVCCMTLSLIVTWCSKEQTLAGKLSFTAQFALSLLLQLVYFQLFSRKTAFLKNFHLWYMVGCPLNFVIALLSYFVNGFSVQAVITLVLFAVSQAVGFTLMRLYFLKSVRVRTYLGTDAYVTQNPFTKKHQAPAPAVPDPVPPLSEPGFDVLAAFGRKAAE